ncbi:MAG TPA: alkaline phosphatase family protein [Polyangia bacterium]|nr:alkaline phosphatase family protein [Polyangia bacterium]
MTSWNRPVAIAALSTVALAACFAPAPKRPRAAGAAPVLITIVVDQMAAWMADERWPALPADGGFARLRREGLTVRQLRYEHAATDTAPGHAALYTGADPRDSGIYANETLGEDGKRRSILFDDDTNLVDVHGKALDRPGASLAHLHVDTLADALVAAAPDARVYSFSLKDRGALFAAGRHPTAALWLDVPTDSFVTSSEYPAPPAWTAEIADGAALKKERAEGWDLDGVDRGWVEAHAETKDDQAGEGDLGGLGRTFPHAIGSAKAMRATPAGDRVLLALTRDTIARVGAERAHGERVPTLIAVSLSSNDYVSHVFGPHSWESWDELLELDRELGALLNVADNDLGHDGYAVMLTSDHGSGGMPEVAPERAHVHCSKVTGGEPYARSCHARRRIMPEAVVAAMEAAAQHALGAGPWIAGFAVPYAYLTAKAKALPAARRAQLVTATTNALAPLGVHEIVDARAATAPCASFSASEVPALETLVCHTIDPKAAPDLYLVVNADAFFDPDVVRGFGASHGSPYLFDRAVPLIVRAPGRVPAGATHDAPVAPSAFTRTAAALLGVAPPLMAAEGENLAR